MIEIKDIEKLAKLSRIKLSDKEKEGFRKEIDSILEYVKQVQEVSTDSSLEPKPDAVHNVLREDKNPHEGGIHTEAILAEAPSTEGQYLKVKKIL